MSLFFVGKPMFENSSTPLQARQKPKSFLIILEGQCYLSNDGGMLVKLISKEAKQEARDGKERRAEEIQNQR